jgi:hypothetical protein
MVTEVLIIEVAGDALIGEVTVMVATVTEEVIITTMAMVPVSLLSIFHQLFFLLPLFTYSLYRFFIKSLRFLSKPSILIV